MEAENSQNFNERLSQWVASQGFWFQLRHPLEGVSAVGHLAGLVTRVLVFLLLAAVAGGFVFFKKMDSAGARKALETSIGVELHANELKAKNISHSMGSLRISRLVGKGGENTFFENLLAVDLRCRTGMAGYMTGVWKVDSVDLDQFDAEIRAGADSEESAGQIAEVIFKKAEQYGVKVIHCDYTSLRWGFSERTRGFIQDSTMVANRIGDRWQFSFKGGTFTQNWLKDVKIVELVASCTPQKIVFEKASFQRDGATIDLSGLEITCGTRPQVTGNARIQHLKLDAALPAGMGDYLEGVISGNFKISGSLNTGEGVALEGRVNLGGQDFITLRDKVKLMDALTLADGRNKYRRMTFNEGSFNLKTSSGGMVLTDANLKAGDLFTLSGSMKVRPPTFEETSKAAVFQMNMENAPTIQEIAGGPKTPQPKVAVEKQIDDEDEAVSPIDDSLGLTGFQSTGQTRAQALDEEEKSVKKLIYDGGFDITLRPDAFDKAPLLAGLTRKDKISGRYLLRVPMEGQLEELTVSQSNQIIEQARR